MKKIFAVLAIALVVFLTPIGVNTVFADSDCPTSQGWKCVELGSDSPSTLGTYIILENKGGIISQIFINGKIYTEGGKKTDCFYLEGLGTVRVNILSNCESIQTLGWYIQPEESATSVPVATLTVTSAVVTTSVVTSTPVVTSTTPVIKATSVATATPVVTKSMYVYWVIPIVIALIVIAFLLYKKKH